MSGGPGYWTIPPFAGKRILGGQALIETDPVRIRPRNSGAHLLDMADGSVVIQLPFTDNDGPENPSYYEWSFEHQATEDSDFHLFEDLRSLGRAVWWVPYQIETESFVAVGGQTAFTLRRYLAVAQYPTFDTSAFPAQAFVDGVEQTVIDTGMPSVGEVKIVGRDVETPALIAGQTLRVRYFPAYAVAIANSDLEYDQFNNLVRSVLLVETAQQVPV